MKSQVIKQIGLVFILIAVLMVTFGTQNISYAQEANLTITAPVEAPLTEANLHGSVVTLTLSGAILERSTFRVRDGVTVSGIDGVTVGTFDIDRISDTEVTVELTFSGNIDADKPLVFTVGAEAIVDYDGAALTAQLPITAVDESLVAATESPLTEVTLSGSVVTLTLSGRSFDSSLYDIERALTISGIEGVTVSRTTRVSDTQVTLALTFSGNIDTDATLTITVGASAIDNYNQALTAQLPVTAVEESLVATTEAPLTETTLNRSVVTLTLSGRSFVEYSREPTIALSGIEGANIARYGIERVSDTKMTVALTFSGNIDVDSTLTITVSADRIANYNQAITAQLTVTAVEESLVAATEENPHLNVVKLTLNGRTFTGNIEDTLTVSSSDGDAVEILHMTYVSATERTVGLGFNGDFNNDVVLTFTLGADAISRYTGPALTAEVTVTPIEVSLTTATESTSLEATLREGEVVLTESPLTESNLSGSVIRLRLSGRQFADWRTLENALTFSSPDGRIVGVNRDDTEVEINGEVIKVGETGGDVGHLNDIGFVRIDDMDRVSESEVLIRLTYFGDLSADAILTLTVGADAITGYNEDFTFEFPITAVEESLTATTDFTLTEENLNGSTVKLSSVRQFWWSLNLDVIEAGALTISGIEGVTIEGIDFPWSGWLASMGDPTIVLGFDGDFDTDTNLTITVKAGVILGYHKDLTVELPVTATQQSDATVSISPSPIALPGIGEKLTLNLEIAGGENVAGYQANVWFDHSVLRYVESTNGDYLPADAFFMTPILDDYIVIDHRLIPDTTSLTIAGNTLAESRNGDGALATLTFEVLDYKPSTVIITEVYLVDADGKQWEVTTQNGEITEPPELANKIFGDLNLDGVVNIQDLIIIRNRFSETGQDIADVNGDLLVDIVDLVLVAGAFGGGAAAPTFHSEALEVFTAADVQQWISQAQHLDRRDPKVQKGILLLERLLTVLTPKETALLANYPNPFNPETWIPYQLTKPADVTITIYAANGQIIRRLALGHQPVGIYHNRSRAAYWDGKNAFGEPVASGVYFYTLTAGDYSATRKMLISK